MASSVHISLGSWFALSGTAEHLFMEKIRRDAAPLWSTNWQKKKKVKKKKSAPRGGIQTHNSLISRHVLYRCATTKAGIYKLGNHRVSAALV